MRGDVPTNNNIPLHVRVSVLLMVLSNTYSGLSSYLKDLSTWHQFPVQLQNFNAVTATTRKYR